MAHTLVTYLFNIFVLYVKVAKNPHAICKVKSNDTMDTNQLKISIIIEIRYVLISFHKFYFLFHHFIIISTYFFFCLLGQL